MNLSRPVPHPSNVVLRSLQIGLPQELGTPEALDGSDPPWTSAIFKQPVSQSVELTRTHLVGDASADRVHHGGTDKAICAYAAIHYSTWQGELGLKELPPGT